MVQDSKNQSDEIVKRFNIRLNRLVRMYEREPDEYCRVLHELKELLDLNPSWFDAIWNSYQNILKSLSDEELDMYSKFVTDDSERFLFISSVLEMVKERPHLAADFFKLARYYQQNVSAIINYHVMAKCIIHAENVATARQLFQEALQLGRSKISQVLNVIGGVLMERPELAPIAERFCEDFLPRSGSEFSSYYLMLARLSHLQPDKISKYLHLFKQAIVQPSNDSVSLFHAYMTLGFMRQMNGVSDGAVNAVCQAGLRSSRNDKQSRQKGWAVLGLSEKLRSKVEVIKYDNTSLSFSDEWQVVQNIPVDRVCVLALGGSLTNVPQVSMKYLEYINEVLQEESLERDVGIYGVSYDFGVKKGKLDDRIELGIVNNGFNFKYAIEEKSHEPSVAERLLMYQNGHFKNMDQRFIAAENVSEDTRDPHYIHQLVDMVLMPRVCENGHRLSLEEAAQRMHRLVVTAHCHGAYVLMKMTDLLQQKMDGLGYTRAEKKAILKEVLCVAHAPYCPLGKIPVTMISFCSAADSVVHHFNHFQEEVTRLAEAGKLGLSFFPDKQGALFLVQRIYDDASDNREEHQFVGFGRDMEELTDFGTDFKYFSEKVLVSGVRSALNEAHLPDVQTLICTDSRTDYKDFQAALSQGKKIYRKILTNARQNRSCEAKQKE